MQPYRFEVFYHFGRVKPTMEAFKHVFERLIGSYRIQVFDNKLPHPPSNGAGRNRPKWTFSRPIFSHPGILATEMLVKPVGGPYLHWFQGISTNIYAYLALKWALKWPFLGFLGISPFSRPYLIDRIFGLFLGYFWTNMFKRHYPTIFRTQKNLIFFQTYRKNYLKI